MAREVLGLLSVVVGVQFSMLANTTVKLLTGVPMLQLMQARFILQWLVSLTCCLCLRGRGVPIHLLGKPGCRMLLAARAGTFSTALGCLWCALRVMPVGEATAITYLNPVVCGVLATYLLGEQLGWRFAAQAAVSCLGVVLVVNPFGSAQATGGSAQQLNQGVALAAIGCVCFAIGNCLVRVLRAVHPLEVQVYQDTLTAWVFMPVAQLVAGTGFELDAWGEKELLLLVCFTLFGLCASFFVIMGYSTAPASKAALFTYLEVPSSFASQVCFFGQVPGPVQLLGAGLVVGAAAGRLLMEFRESKHERQLSQQSQSIDDGDELPFDFQPSRQVSAASYVPALASPASPLILACSAAELAEPMPSPLSLVCLDDPDCPSRQWSVESTPSRQFSSSSAVAAVASLLKRPLLEAVHEAAPAPPPGAAAA